MKKLFLNLFVMGALSFGLQSCSEDEPCDDVTCAVGQICDDGNCVEDPNANCDVCGTYDGVLGGTVTVDNLEPDITGEEAPATISKVGSDYKIVIDLSNAILPGLMPTATGTYDASTKTITFDDAEYSFDITGNGNIADFLISGTAEFNTDGTEIDVDIDLSAPAGANLNVSGNITYLGTK